MLYRRVGLGAASGDYAMLWSPAAQMMGDGAEAFAHDGAINTAPSHDLAHLLVAASSDLPWRPAGDRASIYRAEYNAVMTEHLLDKLYRAHVAGEMAPRDVIPGLLSHGVWFTTKHFTPFPDSTTTALRAWARGMAGGAALGRLSPLFFDMKDGERKDGGYMGRTWTARFRATDRPTGWHDVTPRVAETIQTIAAR